MEPVDYRYERKMLCPGYSGADIHGMLLTHPHGFVEIYSMRFINNIYFDTPDLRLYFQNLNGDGTRRKIRLRWYGNFLQDNTSAALEIKFKKGLAGGKKVFQLPGFDTRQAIKAGPLKSLFDVADLPENLKIELSLAKPTGINRYCRNYFGSLDEKFRCTLDTRLCTESFDRAHDLEAEGEDHFPPLLEFKYSVENERFASDLFQKLPFRLTRFSKYVQSIKKTGQVFY